MGFKNTTPLPKPRASASLAIAVAIAIATLYFAQEVLIPLALSFLLTFLLAPLSTRLERRGLKRVPSVLIVVGLTFIVIIGMGWTVGRQVVKLADDFDQYKDEIFAKGIGSRGPARRWARSSDASATNGKKRPTSRPLSPRRRRRLRASWRRPRRNLMAIH